MLVKNEIFHGRTLGEIMSSKDLLEKAYLKGIDVDGNFWLVTHVLELLDERFADFMNLLPEYYHTKQGVDCFYK